MLAFLLAVIAVSALYCVASKDRYVNRASLLVISTVLLFVGRGDAFACLRCFRRWQKFCAVLRCCSRGGNVDKCLLLPCWRCLGLSGCCCLVVRCWAACAVLRCCALLGMFALFVCSSLVGNQATKTIVVIRIFSER